MQADAGTSQVTNGVTTGVLGGRWRATVTPWGGIHPWSGNLPSGGDEPPLEWHVAADDRWHSPEREPAVRQERVEGTAVVETRLRIPNGDAVHRVYSVPEDGGLTIIEVENASPLPIVVAFTHGRLRSVRPPSAPIDGISLPEGSVAWPVGHHATLVVALPHDGRGAGGLPERMVPLAGVVRGWSTTVDRAGRMLVPDEALAERIVAERCELALCGPAHPDDDPVGFLLAVGQLVRMGEPAEPWTPDVAHAVEQAVQRTDRGRAGDWALGAALVAADTVFAAAADDVARGDLAAMRRLVAVSEDLPADEPDDVGRLLAWVEQRLVQPTTDGAALLPLGLPADWAGSNFEVYGLPHGHGGTVSFAVRWHGSRPAVLWEQTGAAVTLTAPVLAPDWATSEAKGETLWPEPAGVLPPPPAEGESFS